MAAATEILERVQGKDERSNTLAPFVADGLVTLHERLDAARLTEERLLGTIASGLDAKRKDAADHDIRLKSTKLGLELRGLLQRGNRVNVGVASSGNCQVNFAMPWQPAPALSDNPTVPSNSTVTDNRSNNVTSTRSTIEGTGSRGARAGHGHRVQKSRGTTAYVSGGAKKSGKVKMTVEERSKRNKNIKKRVGPNHTSKAGRGKAGNCRSGKCGRCNECKRRRKLQL